MISVLAWLDDRIAACEQRATQVDEDLKFIYLDGAEENRQARAAIAELIEADKEYDDAKYGHACIAHETYKVGAWSDHDERLRVASQRLLAAGERRRAALANVSGGAA